MADRGPPGPVPASPGAPSRFPAAVELDERFLDRLRGCCSVVDTSDAGRAEAGRDWWPLGLAWVAAGSLPARAGAVARPASTAEVAAVVARCGAEGVPLTTAGGRSGVCGAAVPVFGGVVLDVTGMAGVVDVDDRSMVADVRPGTFGDALEADLRGGHGLTLGHWPQSMAISTVGGWVACRSAGQYSTRYGKIEDMVVGLEVVLADGRVVRTGGTAPRAAVGPDLTGLFVGSEGTLGVITEARLRLRPVPPAERRGAWAFDSLEAGLDACRRILRRGATPAALRLYDPAESARVLGVADRAVLIVLDEAEPRLADAVLHLVGEECATAEALDAALVDRWLAHRHDIGAIGAALAAGMVADTCEVAGRWSVLPGLYRALVEGLLAVDGCWSATAHQSHAYPDGACLYLTFAGRRDSPEADEALYREAWDVLMAVTLAAGAAVSHHHGIGLNRGRFLPGALGTAFGVLAALKQALDPRGVLNPGKLGLPSPFGPPPWPAPPKAAPP